jgi:hypothetical protein
MSEVYTCFNDCEKKVPVGSSLLAHSCTVCVLLQRWRKQPHHAVSYDRARCRAPNCTIVAELTTKFFMRKSTKTRQTDKRNPLIKHVRSSYPNNLAIPIPDQVLCACSQNEGRAVGQGSTAHPCALTRTVHGHDGLHVAHCALTDLRGVTLMRE